ncbi:3'5'-cyclic nucleotide phosphodiesterase [Penicillium occitanis (nom. inval.)]|nr:hypothetical protein PENOC_105980 [Penicillium occitanis (nom. inval.)]PCG93099.1 3'5'-cyclic nucleotide phosphodiesterase [Penicillium occitanis (nom. inval.)]
MSADLCDAVYIDDRFGTERWVYRDELFDREAAGELSVIFPDEPERLQSTVKVLFNVCKRIYLCHSNQSFAAALAELSDRAGPECTPIFAFIDVESTGGAAVSRRQETRDVEGSLTMDLVTPFSGRFSFSSESADSYGVQLVALLASDLQLQDGPKLITPIAMMRTPGGLGEAEKMELSQLSHKVCATSLALPSLPSRCIDAGAADVLCQPLHEARVQGLLVHAYRVRRTARKEMTRFLSIKKARKQSWVGVHAEKPYSYLREAMVSKLLESICHPEQVIEEFQYGELNITPERKEMIEREVGVWRFPVHHLTDDELVYAACTMIGHAMTMPEVGPWRLTKAELQTFLLASRAAYNSFVLYHNFRHAVDVLQSVFYILIKIGALPTYDVSNTNTSPSKSPVASLITPFDALTLLIAAIGHDVGHPGVNNVFLVKLNAPLAQLYNDSSVLEAFHCAAFSQILRRHWPAAFHDVNMRKLLISSILATDMGLHFTFMGRMGELQRKYEESGDITSWTPQDRDTYKTLLCGLIIKCADISNVARPWKIAEQWTNLLQEEFAHQGEMEKEIGMETALFGGPPELGNMHKLSLGQINFMSIFALPLFEGVAGLCPEITCTVKHIKMNRSRWQEVANYEEKREAPTISAEHSPRSLSPARRESLKVSTAQENDVSTDQDGKAHVILDQPPEFTNTALPLTDQKDYANGHIDLSQTTMAGFRTAANGAVRDEPSSESQSSDDDDTGESSGATLMAHNKSHHDRASSGRGSRPTSSYGAGRDTRTQSASTTTNTVATPVSPATNATSFVTLDSDDKESRGSELSSASDVYPLDDNHSRPSSSGLYGQRLQPNGHSIPPKPRSSQGFEEFGKSHHLMTAILGNGRNGHDGSLEKVRSPHRSQEQLTSAPCHDLPRKKSRLRLAFWRRKS